jgi:acetoin utilization deacetylase AcuC-like enzyme
MATRLYEHPIFLEHITPEGHPERPDRLRSRSIAREQTKL